MGVVDDVRDTFRGGGNTDTYPVSETVHREGNHVGTFPPETLRELVAEHPGACRTFEMISGAGYEDPNENAVDVSQAEHAGRVEIDAGEILNGLSGESCSCRVRLDTSDPQLVTVVDDTGTKQVEIDDAVARLTPPADDARGDAASHD